MTGAEIEARYRQVLAWDRKGVDYRHMAEKLCLGPYRVQKILVSARRWVASSSEHLTATSPIEALRHRGDARAGLRRQGITTVGQVAALSDADLLRLRGIGPGVLAQLRADLSTRYEQG